MKRARSIVAKGLVLLGLIAAAFGMLSARVVQQGERELRSAEALAAIGKLEEAVLHARTSASWYLPGAPHVPVAYAKMIEIARLAEGRGDKNTALFAWRAVRWSAQSTRWIFIPHEDELAIANASIARLAAKQPTAPGARVRDPADIQQKLHMLLARQDHPRLPWIAVLLAGFVALASGLIHMGWKGYSDDGGLRPSRLRVGGILAAAGVIAWALALWNA